MMNNDSEYLNFLRRLLIFSLILGVPATVLYFTLPSRYITPVLPFLFLFFMAVTLAGYYLLVRSSSKRFIRFVNSYMLITLIKLLMFIAILVIYIFNYRQDAVPFAFSFFILYLFYTVFEVFSLLSYSKNLIK